ncbi:alpha/beta hydrolase [Acinetobacter boissieri]|uniref:Phospholipase/carboxylesterase n=1 Tax=Acinetobacter boissieri TaxID=1219383 RepID=A0A1G6HNA4_9GAMM|nr:dienelactone hydrolase family protein [Acinetobacter boissieri]SDB94926.1 phospholipase/carboxylesterase [Acinetobacter boissieri]
MTKKIVILLHGVGSSGSDFNGLISYWSNQLIDTTIVAPNAPFQFMGNKTKFQWFDIQGVTTENRADRIQQARPLFDQIIDHTCQQHNISVTDKIILVGFSQGSIMALDALVSGRYPLAGVISFSGRLSSNQPWNLNTTPSKVLLIHGTADTIIPHTQTEIAANQLKAHHIHVEMYLEQNTPHTISPQGAEHTLRFIKNI